MRLPNPAGVTDTTGGISEVRGFPSPLRGWAGEPKLALSSIDLSVLTPFGLSFSDYPSRRDVRMWHRPKCARRISYRSRSIDSIDFRRPCENRLGLAVPHHSGCIDWLILGFVISAREDLANQSQAHELDAPQNQHGFRYHHYQRPILEQDLLVGDELLQEELSTQEAAGVAGRQSEEPEEIMRDASRLPSNRNAPMTQSGC